MNNKRFAYTGNGNLSMDAAIAGVLTDPEASRSITNKGLFIMQTSQANSTWKALHFTTQFIPQV